MIILLISICSTLTMVLALALCSCWKRKEQKSDWLGLDGMVTQKNPDENVNHLPAVTVLYTAISENVAAATVNDDPQSSSMVAVTKTRRSLPDIPLEPIRVENALWTEPSGDNSSELYATVEQCNMSKRHTIPNGIDARPSISQHSSISQADGPFSPYARVNYDKVKRENPYASVQNSTSNNEHDENSSDDALLLRPSTSQVTNGDDPVAPPRSRRTSAHSGIGIDIQAASAVAGAIAANVELPYMTPPINQPNFSGDSQDSSKGYTSISVREPLEKIRAQTKEIKKLQRDLDPHYSSVSDESDEMYTTIQEPSNELYMSASETYAQIAPLPIAVNAEVNPVPSTSSAAEEVDDQQPEAAPQPPSVDSLKHVTGHTHSRQASTSSSVGLLGSPKPEKRQANSPLPPPPSNSPDSQRSPVVKNLDDMYAKVHKTRKTAVPADSEDTADRPTACRKLSLTTETEDKIFYVDETTSSKKSPSEAKFRRAEHNYETLKNEAVDPDYEKLKDDLEPGYASINCPDSLVNSDPGYEVLKQNDPNYESLRRRADSVGYSTIKENDLMAGYSVINKKRKVVTEEEIIDEPNYESMPHYVKSTDSENDPNYESVKYLDIDPIDPPYEKLSNDDKTDDSKGYEVIDSSGGSKDGSGDLPYDRLQESESSSYERVKYTENQVPGYETIRSRWKSDEEDPQYDTVIHATKEEKGDTAVDDIFQV